MQLRTSNRKCFNLSSGRQVLQDRRLDLSFLQAIQAAPCLSKSRVPHIYTGNMCQRNSWGNSLVQSLILFLYKYLEVPACFQLVCILGSWPHRPPGSWQQKRCPRPPGRHIYKHSTCKSQKSKESNLNRTPHSLLSSMKREPALDWRLWPATA